MSEFYGFVGFCTCAFVSLCVIAAIIADIRRVNAHIAISSRLDRLEKKNKKGKKK